MENQPSEQQKRLQQLQQHIDRRSSSPPLKELKQQWIEKHSPVLQRIQGQKERREHQLLQHQQSPQAGNSTTTAAATTTTTTIATTVSDTSTTKKRAPLEPIEEADTTLMKKPKRSSAPTLVVTSSEGTPYVMQAFDRAMTNKFFRQTAENAESRNNNSGNNNNNNNNDSGNGKEVAAAPRKEKRGIGRPKGSKTKPKTGEDPKKKQSRKKKKDNPEGDGTDKTVAVKKDKPKSAREGFWLTNIPLKDGPPGSFEERPRPPGDIKYLEGKDWLIAHPNVQKSYNKCFACGIDDELTAKHDGQKIYKTYVPPTHKLKHDLACHPKLDNEGVAQLPLESSEPNNGTVRTFSVSVSVSGESQSSQNDQEEEDSDLDELDDNNKDNAREEEDKEEEEDVEIIEDEEPEGWECVDADIPLSGLQDEDGEGGEEEEKKEDATTRDEPRRTSKSQIVVPYKGTSVSPRYFPLSRKATLPLIESVGRLSLYGCNEYKTSGMAMISAFATRLSCKEFPSVNEGATILVPLEGSVICVKNLRFIPHVMVEWKPLAADRPREIDRGIPGKLGYRLSIPESDNEWERSLIDRARGALTAMHGIITLYGMGTDAEIDGEPQTFLSKFNLSETTEGWEVKDMELIGASVLFGADMLPIQTGSAFRIIEDEGQITYHPVLCLKIKRITKQRGEEKNGS